MKKVKFTTKFESVFEIFVASQSVDRYETFVLFATCNVGEILTSPTLSLFYNDFPVDTINEEGFTLPAKCLLHTRIIRFGFSNSFLFFFCFPRDSTFLHARNLRALTLRRRDDSNWTVWIAGVPCLFGARTSWRDLRRPVARRRIAHRSTPPWPWWRFSTAFLTKKKKDF